MVNFKRAVLKTALEAENVSRDFTHQPNWVTPKRATVVRASEFTPASLKLGEEFTARGKFYPIEPEAIISKRTVFSSQPFTANGNDYFLELKGYGRDGKELTFAEHSSGDVYFGMYLDEALKEFDRLQFALDLKLPVVLPIAALHIPRDEFVRSGMKGFEKFIDSWLGFYLDAEKTAELLGLDHNTMRFPAAAGKLVKYIEANYDNFEEGIKEVIPRLDYNKLPNRKAIDIAKALLSHKEVGYVIRASKCPVRVGDPSDKERIETDENKEIAVEMGRTFRTLLENGYLHHCPGTGNWTIAGELTDLQDTFDLKTERQQLAAHMKKLGYRSERKYLEYLIGPKHTGVLSKQFIQGVAGESAGVRKAAEMLVKYF